MHEGATLTAPEQLRMRPDMAEFEAEFQAPHEHTVDCSHHHAEQVHIDHVEDHSAIVARTHESEHDNHEHVHGEGCGCVEYQNAHKDIDPHHTAHDHKGDHGHEHSEHVHNKDGSCCSAGHGDIKEKVDPHDLHAEVHTEADHVHVGKQHIDHEKHHDAGHKECGGCASCTPKDVEPLVDRNDCASGSCGHEHHRSKQVNDAIDLEKIHPYDHIVKTDTPPTHQKTEADHHHNEHDEHEAAAHLHDETEPITTPDATQEVEKAYRQQQANVQEQVARIQEEDVTRKSEAEVVSVPDAVKAAEVVLSPEKQVEHAKPREAEATVTNVDDAITEKAADPKTYGSEVETATSETESVIEMPTVNLDQEQVSMPPESTEFAEGTVMKESVIPQPLQLVYEDAPVSESLPTESATLTEAAPTVVDEVAISEVFESLDITPVILPMLETDASNEASASATQPGTAIESTATSQIRDAEPVRSMNESLTEVVATIVERYDDLEKQLASAAPEHLQKIQKTLTNIHTAFRLSHEQGSIPENIQRQLVQLLQLLGFEDPSRALTAYIHQYGIDFVDALMARLLELLSQGRYFEGLHMLLPQTFSDHDSGLVTKLGAAVVHLVSGLSERLPLPLATDHDYGQAYSI